MTWLLALLLTTSAAVAQLALESIAGGGLGLPLFTIGAIAAWALARDPVEAGVAAIPPAVVLGVASEQRVGWLLVALLPTVLIASAARRVGARRTTLVAGVVGGLGAAAYLGLTALGVPGGGPGGSESVHEAVRAAAVAALWTGGGAILVAAVLRPFRPRERGLFW